VLASALLEQIIHPCYGTHFEVAWSLVDYAVAGVLVKFGSALVDSLLSYHFDLWENRLIRLGLRYFLRISSFWLITVWIMACLSPGNISLRIHDVIRRKK